MVVLITWIAITCLWASNISTRTTTNEISNNDLKIEVKKLTTQIARTNEILARLEGKMEK
jgi:hypothetical protein